MKCLRSSIPVEMAAAVFVISHLLAADAQAGAPTFRWAQRAGGLDRDYGTGVAVDSADNSSVLGKFNGPTAHFGSMTLTNGGLFVARYNPNGNPLWVRQVAPPSLANAPLTDYYIPRITADALGNTYVAGMFYGQMDFGEATLVNGDPNAPDMFLAKYDTAGNLAWARKGAQSGATNRVYVSASNGDAAGNCYLAGYYLGPASFGGTVLTGVDLFITKFDTTGDVAWARRLLGGSAALPRMIAPGASGDYYLAGHFSGNTVTFGSFTFTNAGSFDLFLLRYDSAGNLLWARQGGGAGPDDFAGIGVDATGDCYLAGRITGSSGNASVSFDGCTLTNTIAFLVKYDRAGNVRWCRRGLQISGDPILTVGLILRSAVDAAGNSYLHGLFQSTATFDNISLTNRGGTGDNPGDYPSSFLAKFDADGQVAWAKQFGGGDGEHNYFEKSGIAVDAAGNGSVTGFFVITNSPFDTFTLSPVSSDEDVFVARFDADPPPLNLTRAGDSIVLSWPTNQPGFVLECANSLAATNGWSLLTNAVTVVGFQNFLTNTATGDSQFYRLRKQ